MAASVASLLLARPLLLLIPLIGAVVLVGRLANSRADAALNWTKGARSEEAVGELLEPLVDEGYVVVHDVEQPREGNVDHVVCGPTGAFLVETKHRWYEERALTKAKRQAAKLHDVLGVWVTPVLCVHRRRRRPFRDSGVWVMSADHLPGWIRAQQGRPAGPEVAERCRRL
jgi:hypothetical protein